MEARPISDRNMWNAFVRTAATGHICQTYEWPEHVSEHARSDSLRLGVCEGDRLLAATLLVRSQARQVRAPFYYVPRGPVCADPTSPAVRALVACARREASRRGAFMIRVEPNVPVEHEQASNWLHALDHLGFRSTNHVLYPRSAWMTDLRPCTEDLLAHMSQTWRYGIHAAPRRGITVRQGAGEADFDAFYRLITETAQRDQFQIYPRALYQDMLAHYTAASAAQSGTAEMALFLADYQGAPIAAATIAVLGDRAWYMHAASSSLPEHRKLDPGRCLMWEGICWAKARGATLFDWRAIPDVPKPGEELYGVYEFKRGFGGYAEQVIPTHDLVLRPAIYWPYMAVTELRKRWNKRHRHAFENQRWSDTLRRVSSHRTPKRQGPAGEDARHGDMAPA